MHDPFQIQHQMIPGFGAYSSMGNPFTPYGFNAGAGWGGQHTGPFTSAQNPIANAIAQQLVAQNPALAAHIVSSVASQLGAQQYNNPYQQQLYQQYPQQYQQQYPQLGFAGGFQQSPFAQSMGQFGNPYAASQLAPQSWVGQGGPQLGQFNPLLAFAGRTLHTQGNNPWAAF